MINDKLDFSSHQFFGLYANYYSCSTWLTLGMNISKKYWIQLGPGRDRLAGKPKSSVSIEFCQDRNWPKIQAKIIYWAKYSVILACFCSRLISIIGVHYFFHCFFYRLNFCSNVTFTEAFINLIFRYFIWSIFNIFVYDIFSWWN